MEKLDSGDHEEEFCLELESLFDDAADLLVDETLTPFQQQTQSDGNITKQENVELGSSCGSNNEQQQQQQGVTNNVEGAICSMEKEKENITVFTGSSTSNAIGLHDLSPPFENHSYSETHHFKDVTKSELGATSHADCDGGQEHAQINHDLEPLTHIDEQGSGSGDITSSVPPLVNVKTDDHHEPNSHAQHSGPGPVLPAPVSQNYPPIMLDYAEVRSAAGNNWSNNVNHYANSSINNQNVVMSNNMQPSVIPSSNVQFQSSNPSIGVHYGRDTRSHLNATIPILQLTNQNQNHNQNLNLTAQVNGIAHSFGRVNHHDPQSNMIYTSYQYPNAYPENVSRVLDQHVPAAHQFGPRINNQVLQNNTNNYGNFIINGPQQQQAYLYPANAIFSPNTMMTCGMGVVNQFNRQMNNAPQQVIFAPQTQLLANIGANFRPVPNINPPGYNWVQQLSSQHPQMSTQVPPMPYVVNYNPYAQYSTQSHGYSALIRPQNISYHHHQVPVAPTQFDPAVFNSTLQPNVQVVSFNHRPPQQVINNEVRASTLNFIMPSSLSSSRIYPASHYSDALNVAPHQRNFGTAVIQPPNLSRLMCDNNQRQFHATNSDHFLGSSNQVHSFFARSQLGVYGATANSTNSTHLLNSQQAGVQGNGQAIVIQNNSASSTKENGITLERRGRGRPPTRKRLDVGEPSMSSKRLKREEEEIGEVPKNDAADNSNVTADQPTNFSRKITNSVYDPLYEGKGLAIDPHIRFFTSN